MIRGIIVVVFSVFLGLVVKGRLENRDLRREVEDLEKIVEEKIRK